MIVNYWNRELETIDKASLEKLQLRRLREIVDFALRTAFYKSRLPKVGISSPDDLRTIKSVMELSFSFG